MKREEIRKDITDIFRTVLNNQELILKDSTAAKDIEEWDSLNHIILITAMEEHFRIKFKLKEIVSMQNVGDVIDIIMGKL